jgi:hypothetical protein
MTPSFFSLGFLLFAYYLHVVCAYWQTPIRAGRTFFEFFITVSGNASYFFGDYLILTLKSGLVKGKIYFRGKFI